MFLHHKDSRGAPLEANEDKANTAVPNNNYRATAVHSVYQ